HLFLFIVTHRGKSHVHRQNPARIEAQRSLLSIPETFQHESASGEQDHRECDLRDHQCRTGPLPMNSIAASARTFVKREGERAVLRDTPRGPEPDQHSREESDGDSKSEGDGINERFMVTRDSCGAKSKNGIKTPNGEDDPGEGPEKGEDRVFSENLARQP